MNGWRAIQLLVAVSLVTACSEALQQDLSERAANEVVVVLHAEGVAGRKVQSAAGWTVEVPTTQLQQGLAVLTEYGLPRAEPDMAALSSSGLVPSEADERMRQSAHLEGALRHTLLALDGVLDAHVHIVLPAGRSGLSRTETPAARASIVLVLREGRASPGDDAIKAIALGAVERLDPSQIAIVRSQARLPGLPETELVALGPYAVASTSVAGLRQLLAGLAATIGALSLALIWSVVRRETTV